MSNEQFLNNRQIPTKAIQKDSNNALNKIDKKQNESDTIDNINEEKIPPSSKWHFIFSPKIPIWTFDDQKIILINLSREKFFPYYFCHILITIVYFYYYFVLSKYIFPNDIHKKKVVFHSTTYFFIITHLCYLTVHFTSPGILPWNWESTKQRFYTKDELRDGIAINHVQKEWGKNHDWPARSFFSGNFGAIILKAEHYCPWVSQWIGLRNFKFYIQSLFYSVIFTIEYLYIAYNVYKNPEATQIKKQLIYISSILVSLFFLYSFTTNFFINIYRVAFNYTLVESLFYFDTSYYSKGIRKNFEEVFGSIYLFPLWFLPVIIPLPKDGLDYQYRPNAIELAKNRNGEEYKEHKR